MLGVSTIAHTGFEVTVCKGTRMLKHFWKTKACGQQCRKAICAGDEPSRSLHFPKASSILILKDLEQRADDLYNNRQLCSEDLASVGLLQGLGFIPKPKP